MRQKSVDVIADYLIIRINEMWGNDRLIGGTSIKGGAA